MASRSAVGTTRADGGRQPGRGQPLARRRRSQGQRGAERVGAGAEDDGVAALHAERRRLGRHVGAGLVDHQDHAERDADPPHGSRPLGRRQESVTSPMGSGSDATSSMAAAMPGEPPRVERQPVEVGGVLAGRRRAGSRSSRLAARMAGAPGQDGLGPGAQGGGPSGGRARARARARPPWPRWPGPASRRGAWCSRSSMASLGAPSYHRAVEEHEIVPVDHLVGVP